MEPAGMLKVFCDAVEQRDGTAFAQLFADDGIYHDVGARLEDIALTIHAHPTQSEGLHEAV
jgi:pyruvate/2-oxoglutarate dehydrogenase complex dihydrolipoamide dehydrogenase (E3) component